MKTIDSEQLPIVENGTETIYQFERDEGILQFTLRKGQPSMAEWLEFDDERQDWIGTQVPVKEIMRLLPKQLYTKSK